MAASSSPVRATVRYRTRARLIGILAMTAAAAILIAIVLVPPPVGVADDGDFAKVAGLFNLRPVPAANEPLHYAYVFSRYAFDPGAHWWAGLPSSEMLLMHPALAFNRWFFKRGGFDLRAMGVVHAALLLLALALFLRLLRDGSSGRMALVAAAAVWMYCDVMYSSYCNSFYMDTAALLFLLLAAVFYMRVVTAAPARWMDRIGFMGSCFLFATAKAQHSLLGLALAALLFLQGWRRTAVLLGALCLFWMMQVPVDYSGTARYNLIFFRILPNAPDRAQALRELGLDDSYAGNIGKYAYTEGSGMGDAEFVRRFDERATFPRLAMYYARHPLTPLRLLGLGLNEAALQRARLGNYPRETGRPPGAQSTAFSSWSALKQAIFGSRGWLFGLYAAVLCSLLPLLVYGRRELFAGAVALSAMTMSALGIACLGDALDYTRHLFLFNACLDMLALGCLAALSTRLTASQCARWLHRFRRYSYSRS